MLLTVVIPVYNGGDEIVANVELIRSRVAEGLPHERLEVVVVSDGSIDVCSRVVRRRASGSSTTTVTSARVTR
jgi:glycosyltransferase involved in cell wall biosynthesis